MHLGNIFIPEKRQIAYVQPYIYTQRMHWVRFCCFCRVICAAWSSSGRATETAESFRRKGIEAAAARLCPELDVMETGYVEEKGACFNPSDIAPNGPRGWTALRNVTVRRHDTVMRLV
jgi:hypothetical protein